MLTKYKNIFNNIMIISLIITGKIILKFSLFNKNNNHKIIILGSRIVFELLFICLYK